MLSQLLATRSGDLPRIAILGIGNPLRSDDAAGVLVARQLMKFRFIPDLDFIRVLEAGHAPENCTAELRCFAPEIVILIDAAQMDEGPGAVRWIDMEDLGGLSASTHSMPLSMLAKYLRLELDCDVKLLGIQPNSIEVGETMAAEVQQAVDEIVEELTNLLKHAAAQESTCLN